MDKQVIFSMSKVGKVVGAKRFILKDIQLSFYYGAKIGVLGLNGSGKSSLLKIIAGLDKDYIGEISFSKGYRVGILEQEPKLDENKTVREIVQEGAQETVDLLQQFESISAKLCEPMSDSEMDKLLAEQAQLQDKLDAANAWELDSRLDLAMESLRCPPADTLVKVISGGEKRRVALCRLLLQAPEILLLDEPTNHLDAQSVAWLEQHLQNYQGTIIAVTHDRYFLDNVAGWILELDRGHGIPWKGNYSSWLEQKTKRMEQEEKAESKRQKALKEELEWIRQNPKGRQAKSKARIANYERMLAKDYEKTRETNEILIPSGPRLGNNVIEAENISKSFGDLLLYEKVNFKLPPGGIVGIIGPNGAGKTTLFKMITGELKPDTGSFKVGESVQLAHADQHRNMDDEKTLFEVISGGLETITIGASEVNARAYLSRFNFHGDDHAKKVKHLSGGERGRLHLAMMLKSGGNVLLLDEPTNDLDVHTLRALEKALLDFAGCAVVITHDRYFLDRVATHMMAFEGNSHVEWFEGNYQSYMEDLRRRKGDEADRPSRLMYRKLTR